MKTAKEIQELIIKMEKEILEGHNIETQLTYKRKQVTILKWVLE